MRRNLAVIAVGLLAVTGCAHERPNRKAVDEAFAYVKTSADPQPSGRLVQGGNPCGGAVTFGPASPPAVPKPVIASQSGLPPVEAVPRLPDAALPREMPVLPPPMPTPVIPNKPAPTQVIPGKPPSPQVIPDSSTSPAPSRIPDVQPKPAPPARVRNPEAQTSQVLTGTVESWRKTQRLRYAPADVEEANGGLVTLVGDPELDRVREGQRIRVRGFLIPSVDRTHPPTFQVQSIEVVE